MMCAGAAAVVFLAYFAQAHGDEVLEDKLTSRASHLLQWHHCGVDSTTLGKPGGMLAPSSASWPQALAPCHGSTFLPATWRSPRRAQFWTRCISEREDRKKKPPPLREETADEWLERNYPEGPLVESDEDEPRGMYDGENIHPYWRVKGDPLDILEYEHEYDTPVYPRPQPPKPLLKGDEYIGIKPEILDRIVKPEDKPSWSDGLGVYNASDGWEMAWEELMDTSQFIRVMSAASWMGYSEHGRGAVLLRVIHDDPKGIAEDREERKYKGMKSIPNVMHLEELEYISIKDLDTLPKEPEDEPIVEHMAKMMNVYDPELEFVFFLQWGEVWVGDKIRSHYDIPPAEMLEQLKLENKLDEEDYHERMREAEEQAREPSAKKRSKRDESDSVLADLESGDDESASLVDEAEIDGGVDASVVLDDEVDADNGDDVIGDLEEESEDDGSDDMLASLYEDIEDVGDIVEDDPDFLAPEPEEEKPKPTKTRRKRTLRKRED
eukprot:gnl/TRDRNA2_/TRDRNA2_134936_c0_seq1.p1 gnl/TRDRNA2_/TRDRNA2_134936_c0~~gnl/TRDRNA2_/TRDRNA2_134936_c0_seq1.p1  ORF type:complete len:494 (-),score=99.86 gnl/TRDRNA2_/TRDRNA2_134936_c0_seq1:149-1630(-)